MIFWRLKTCELTQDRLQNRRLEAQKSELPDPKTTFLYCYPSNSYPYQPPVPMKPLKWAEEDGQPSTSWSC